MSEEKRSYTPAPEVPEEAKERFDAVMLAITGETTVTEGAKRLGVSRVYFQTLMHQVLGAMVGAATKKKPGRKPLPPREAELQAKVRELEAENARLVEQAELMERLLAGASEVIRQGIRPRERQAKAAAEKAGDGDKDPAGRARWVLGEARDLARVLGSPERAAVALRTGASSIRRYAMRRRAGEALVKRRGPGPKGAPSETARESVAALVRRSEGLIGAGALAASVSVVSRRDAAAIKATTLTTIERERKADAIRVIVTVPGIIRGFDAMDVMTEEGRRRLLIAADGCVSFRTSGVLVPVYDGVTVAHVLENDFTENGAPLALRLDRWKAHLAQEVLAVLRRFGVLALHGPAHLPRFYGQLERQNREHRAFLRGLADRSLLAIEGAIPRMLNVLSSVWKRASLGYRTAREVWMARPQLLVDRDELRDEVLALTAQIAAKLALAGKPTYQADRFAIEAALTRRGFLHRVHGGHR